MIGRSPRSGVHASLADARRYERQIDRLHQRHLFDGGLHRLTDGEVSLATVVMHRSQVARLLARSVAKGEYRSRPATLRTIVVEGKRRQVFMYPLLDLIVHGVVADVLAEAIEPSLSASLHSYRAGHSSMAGVSGFARHVRDHNRSHPDPRTRGLYVLRRDVDAYTDSIPVGPDSALWRMLDEAIERRGAPLPTPAERELITEIVQPVVGAADGTSAAREAGVATGQPISCVVFNVYLSEIDREVQAIEGAFYARYSDDLLFAHPDPDVARRVAGLLDERLAGLGVRFGDEKRRDLYLTGAGRASDAWPEAAGTTSVGFLGMRISAQGSVAIGRRKVRGLLRDARRRAANSVASLDGDDAAGVEIRGRAATRALNRLLDVDDPQLGGAAALLLARAVTDRGQLDELDHALASIVAGAAAGRHGAAAFRTVAYRQIRDEWRLTSLRRARDNGGRARKAR